MKPNFLRKNVKVKCRNCNGTGDIKTTKQVVAKLGLVDILNECPQCNGEGHIEKTILVQDKTLNIQIKQ